MKQSAFLTCLALMFLSALFTVLKVTGNDNVKNDASATISSTVRSTHTYFLARNPQNTAVRKKLSTFLNALNQTSEISDRVITITPLGNSGTQDGEPTYIGILVTHSPVGIN